MRLAIIICCGLLLSHCRTHQGTNLRSIDPDEQAQKLEPEVAPPEGEESKSSPEEEAADTPETDKKEQPLRPDLEGFRPKGKRLNEQFQVALRSQWSSQCQTETSEARSAPHDWGTWSPSLVTSQWNGAPWSCLNVRLQTNSPTLQITLKLRSSWGSDCKTGVIETGFAGTDVERWSFKSEWGRNCQTSTVSTGSTRLDHRGRLVSDWTPGLITSDWDGEPWSCLKAKLVCEPRFEFN